MVHQFSRVVVPLLAGLALTAAGQSQTAAPAEPIEVVVDAAKSGAKSRP